MNFIVAKAETRKAAEGKDTIFSRGDTQITSERIENFKKRKVFTGAAVTSPIAGKWMPMRE
jgi:hypothetical protein